MVLHPSFTLPASAAAEAFADEGPHYDTQDQAQLFVRTSGFEGNDPRLLVTAATNPAAFFPLLAQGANGPLANFKPSGAASSIVQYCGQLPVWFRKFIHYGLTAGDIIAVLAARSSKRNAMRVLSYAEKLGISALGAALVPRSVMDHTEYVQPTVSDALDILGKLALSPEYHSVAVGALLRWHIMCFSRGTVLPKVADYMESCGIARAPTLEMYAALWRRDGHALVTCDGQSGITPRSALAGTGDAPSDSGTAKVLEEEFTAANRSHMYLRSVAIAERLPTDTWAYARIAHYALHTSTASPIDALALALDLAKTNLTEDMTVAFLKKALLHDLTDQSANLLVEHSGVRTYLLAQAMVLPISQRKFQSVDSAYLYAARFAASTPADGSTSAPARRQASLHIACQAINDACALRLAMDDDSFTGGADILFVLLIRAIDSTAYGGFGAIFAHPKFRGTLGFHHAVHRACTHAIALNSPDALWNILTACQPHGIVAIICSLIVTVSSYLSEVYHLQCVASFFPDQAQRGRHTKDRLASALKIAVEEHRRICEWEKLLRVANTANMCKIDVHREVIDVLNETYIKDLDRIAETFADMHTYFGEHSQNVAIAVYRKIAQTYYMQPEIVARIRDTCPPISLEERMAWAVDSSNWRTVFPELADNDVAELFIGRCKAALDVNDWTASAVQNTRLRISQRKRVIEVYREQCFRKLLSMNNEHYVSVDLAQFPSDGAICPLCFEEISATAVSASDPLAMFTGLMISPPAGSDSLCSSSACDDLEPEEGTKFLPSMLALKEEANKILANVAADLRPVAAKCPGKHLAHRECMRLWFVRKKACPVCSFPL